MYFTCLVLPLLLQGLGKLPKLPSELGSTSQRRHSGPEFQKNTESSRGGPPHHTEGQSSAATRDRHASAPATAPTHGHRKIAPVMDSRRAVHHSKSPPLLSKSPPPHSRPPPPRSKSPPPHSRPLPRRSTSPPPHGRSPPPHGRSSPFRSKSPTRQEPRVQKAAGGNVTFQNHTIYTVEVAEAPQGVQRVGNAPRVPLVRSHSVKTPNLPITVISEEPEEEEEPTGGANMSTFHHLKDLQQRPHSFSGRGAKMRTPLPMRPSPLLISETRHGVTTLSPSTSPIYRTSSLPMDDGAHRSNSLPLIGEYSPDEEDTMFSSGVGSQVMHVSVSSPTKEMLFAEGRKYLDDRHLCSVKARLQEVRVATL